MKNLKFYTVIIALAMIVSSCGTSATPTMDPNDVQNTAIAAAFTIVAQTQAAIPTATPIPPTETASPTPLPTDTPIPLPTLPALEPTQTQASSSGGGTDCLAPLNVGGAGPTHKTLIKNEIGGVKTLTISLQLWTPNKFGACGIIPASPGMVNLPAGSWYALAWVTLNNGKNLTTSGSFFVQYAQFDKLELCIRKSDITYSPSC